MGLTAAPNQALAFLVGLAARTQPVEFGDVAGVLDPALGATVVAGFPRPNTGRVHIIRSLREQLVQAEEIGREAHAAAGIARQVEAEAEGTLAAARAAAERGELSSELRTIETTELPAARENVEELLAIRDTSMDTHTDAQADLRSAKAALAKAEAARGESERRIAGSKIERDEVQRKLDAVRSLYWRIELGGDHDVARTVLNWAMVRSTSMRRLAFARSSVRGTRRHRQNGARRTR